MRMGAWLASKMSGNDWVCVKQWFSARGSFVKVVPHVDCIFDVFVGEGELCVFLFCLSSRDCFAHGTLGNIWGHFWLS